MVQVEMEGRFRSWAACPRCGERLTFNRVGDLGNSDLAYFHRGQTARLSGLHSLREWAASLHADATRSPNPSAHPEYKRWFN